MSTSIVDEYQLIARGTSGLSKGGSLLDSPRAVRPGARDNFSPDRRSYRVGFRVAMEVPQQP
jgi:formylglycine-generating enzyme required for sulfatase activity